MTTPCTTDRDGRTIDSFCDQCHHALLAHRADLTCSICELSDIITTRFERVEDDVNRIIRES